MPSANKEGVCHALPQVRANSVPTQRMEIEDLRFCLPPSYDEQIPFYEHKYRGPDKQVIDVTETGWLGT